MNPDKIATAGQPALTNTNAPRQKRSAATQRRILDAVGALVDAGRYSQATVQEIVSLSGSSIGAFYGRFKDKDAALYVFYDERCSQLETLVQERVCSGAGRPKDLVAAIRRFIDIVVDQTFAGAAILRASTSLVSEQTSAAFWARAKAMNARLFDCIEDLLVACQSGHSHPDPRVAALYVAAIVGGLSRDAILIAPRVVGETGDSATFKRELNRAILGYLGCETRP